MMGLKMCYADTNDGFICVPLSLKDFDKAQESFSITRNPGIDLQSK